MINVEMMNIHNGLNEFHVHLLLLGDETNEFPDQDSVIPSVPNAFFRTI